MSKEWLGRVVLITGAANGIGAALAYSYAVHGASLILVDKDAESLQHTVEHIRTVIAAGPETERAAHAQIEAFTVDLSKATEIEQLFTHLRDRKQRVDVLINNAGLGMTRSPYELTLDEWDYVLNTNLRGTFLCAREAASMMRMYGGGSIVNIASTRALMSEPNTEAYAASKGGILALTHALAVSLGPDHITVNAISPGWIETGAYDALREADHLQHPAQRVGKPDDIARACLYLTSPDNDFVTGINLVVDGGMTRKMIYEE